MHRALLAVATAATTKKLSVGEEAYLPHAKKNRKEMGPYNGPFLYSLHSTFESCYGLFLRCAWQAMMTAKFVWIG